MFVSGNDSQKVAICDNPNWTTLEQFKNKRCGVDHLT